MLVDDNILLSVLFNTEFLSSACVQWLITPAELLSRQVDFKVFREQIATRIVLDTGRSLEVTVFNSPGRL